VAACLLAVTPFSTGGTDSLEAQREAMVREVEAMAQAAADETGRARLDPRVLDALRRVARHEFVPAGRVGEAYANYPLPIGHGQTISQPYIVALMTDLLGPRPGDHVLEIGTGSGYQAAVLAEVVERVYTIEIVEPLARDAAARLARLGYRNVVVRAGDGYAGWPEHAPFDGIMVTAAPDHVPPALVDQLKPGGRLVVPVGSQAGGQSLLLIEKGADGQVSRRSVLPVRFVPLTRRP
jgi:protein-L-isoaspartate(D-aspartate) O-methyltransferase